MTQQEILKIRRRDRELVFICALVAAVLHYVGIVSIRLPQIAPKALDVPAPENLVLIHAYAPPGTEAAGASPQLAPESGQLAQSEAPLPRVSAGDVPPKVLQLAAPSFPVAMRSAHVRGVVVLDVEIRQDGSVGRVLVRSGLSKALDDAAIDAVQRSTFLPGSSHGQPVDAATTVEIRFR
jgi:TonB family protein